MCEIGSGKNKICLLHRDHSESHIYLFALSAQGHCFHDDSLMASFASLFLIFFFHSTPFISAISLFEDPSWPSRFYLPLHHPLSFTFHPWLPLSKALLFERQNEKNQGVNRLQERQCFDGLKMMQHQSVCVWVFSSDKNETEQGSLQYQRPLSPVICWAHGEWSLMLFCYQLSSVSLQMNCWYRLMSYNPARLLFFCWFLAASLTMLAPSTFVWQGHTTLQSSLICLFICITDGLTALELLWPWGDGKVMRHRVDVDHYWFNREATHSSLMLPFIFPSNILLSCSACHWLGQDKWGKVRG